MNHDCLPISLYHKYRQEELTPFLLESRGPKTSYSSKTILAFNPKRKLVCRNGQLIENGETIGNALDLFSHLELNKTSSFFPAWLGCFSYEFGKYFGLPTKRLSNQCPEAVFYYFEDGHIWEDGQDIRAQDHNDTRLEATISPQPFFNDAFAKVINSINQGDVYQVNLAKKLNFDVKKLDLFNLYLRLQELNPSPFMGLIEDEEWGIACASPERLLRLNEEKLSSRPIAGTRARSADTRIDQSLENELLNCPKERAEHAMLVDLVRNDLTRVCQPGTVSVDEAYIVERYSHVMHLVSEVSGTSSCKLKDIFASLFPAGTITGTPKESAMAHIRDLEPFERGFYTGSMGYISSGMGTDFNILIRSAFKNGHNGHIFAGAGIVAKSEAPKEGSEVSSKANSVALALKKVKSNCTPALPMKGDSFPNRNIKKHFDAEVVFVENHDSFSHNIVDALRRLGCRVRVVDHKEKPNLLDARHVVFGPGPKSPKDSGLLQEWLDVSIKENVSVLGICLGHQALGLHFGASLKKAQTPIHGEVHDMEHFGHPLFSGIPRNFSAMRYHSLVITQVPSCFEVIACSASDEVMAIAHKNRPWFGVQFHPESFLSERGEQVFYNFLKMNP